MEVVREQSVSPAQVAFRARPRPALASLGRAGSLFVVLVLLNAADLLTTRLVLDRGGAEANPLFEPVVASLFGAVAVKGLCLAAIGALLARSRRSPRILMVLVAVNVWYAFVVVWNIGVLTHVA